MLQGYAGRRRFKRCSLKVVEIRETKEQSRGSMPFRADAALHCPATEADDRITVKTHMYGSTDVVAFEGATNDLQYKAGLMLCPTCPYYAMTIVEADQYRTKRAQATAERLKAETELQKIRQELERGSSFELPPAGDPRNVEQGQ